jgi:beta-phosphoglucomutase
MDWIEAYDLFLFDFDGLLVDTEPVHYQAYQNVCAKWGLLLPWDMPTYLSIAHKHNTALKEAICHLFSEKRTPIPSWNDFYAAKKEEYMTLLPHSKAPLMPGVPTVLKELERLGKKRCVVTHSTRALVEPMRLSHQVLESIPHWITREDYDNAKPSPDGYLKAISLYAKKGDKIIGFEDSLRGVNSLLGTPAKPVWICSGHYPLLDAELDKRVCHVPSFDHLALELLR